jgi:hypothetical protein
MPIAIAGMLDLGCIYSIPKKIAQHEAGQEEVSL